MNKRTQGILDEKAWPPNFCLMCINYAKYPGSKCPEQPRKMIRTILGLFYWYEGKKKYGAEIKNKFPCI